VAPVSSVIPKVPSSLHAGVVYPDGASARTADMRDSFSVSTRSNQAGADKSFLIVDASALARSMLGRTLLQLYPLCRIVDLESAASLSQAVQLELRSGRSFDVVFIAVQLSLADSALISSVRLVGYRGCIIGMTTEPCSGVSMAMADRARDIGADYVLEKLVSKALLEAVLNKRHKTSSRISEDSASFQATKLNR
jgi:hypothetical protein